MRVYPLPLSLKEFVSRVKSIFGLDKFPFEDIDDDLLLLAFTANCNYIREKHELLAAYGTCDHESLEFYGDRVLYDVISLILYDIFGLQITPGLLTRIMSFITSNRTLTDVMLNKNACVLVRSFPYTITGHNECADSFEALIGALFVHLVNKRLNHSEYISRWILDNTTIPGFLEEYFVIHRIPVLIYSYSDEAQTLYTNVKRPLQTIYRDLGWEYTPPVEINGRYYLYVQGEIIGEGNSPEEAEEKGLEFLIANKQVFPLEVPRKVFSKI